VTSAHDRSLLEVMENAVVGGGLRFGLGASRIIGSAIDD
jgi:hypothetical protein